MDQNKAKENIGFKKEIKQQCLIKFFELLTGTYCALASNKATDHVISDNDSNLRAVLYKTSNVTPLITACMPLLTEVCAMLAISDLALLTSANPTSGNA